MINQTTSIRDNSINRGSVGEFLRSKINDNDNLSIVSAYFTIYAYYYLKDTLNKINNLRFIFGEPTFIKSLDPSKINKRDFKIEDEKIVIPIEKYLSQKFIARECSNWIKNKVSIKSMVKPNFLHGKLYQIENNNEPQAILGSSNFTVNGLGLGTNPNIELNIIIEDRRDLRDLKLWFEEIWNNKSGLVEDVKEEVLEYLNQLYIENEPEFIYFKTLFHIFEKYINEEQKGILINSKTGFYDTQIWNRLYQFQKDGVKGAINKILKHNGCIIADSVGLGKTFEALAIIKYFELLNFRVLVICPKKLSSNWTIYQSNQNNVLNPFIKDRFNYTVLYHTDLGRESGKSDANGIDLNNFNWGVFDLVVIDESHNFKGNPLEKVKHDGSKKMNRAKWLMEKIIKSGSKTKVLLLSATPVNNNLKDIRNQIYLITEGRDDALFEKSQIKNIAQTIKIAQTNFTNWAESKKNSERNVKQLMEKLDSSFFKLLDELTIARSRKHISNFYNKEMKNIGNFPERLKPKSIYSNIDINDDFFTYDALNKNISEYKLSLFNPSSYIKKEKRKEYEEKSENKIRAFKQSDRENYLIGMMKVNFLKRLESSIESFEISMKKTIDKIELLENKITDFIKSNDNEKEEIIEEPDFNDEEIDDTEELDKLQVGKKLKFQLKDLDLEIWLEDLRTDKKSLKELYNKARLITPDRDDKLISLKKIILEKVSEPLNKNNKKVIIFTAFSDTAKYLYDCLKDWIKEELNLNTALVSGTETRTSFGKNDFLHILTNFSPLSKERSKITSMPQQEQIDILFATDCISEGQNLQDCDFLVNYDIHWNPVRIIQRFGRIDRLGSINKKIQLVNFWPTKDLDNYINLKERVESRMALVDLTATGEDNILNTEQIEELLLEEDLKYRNQQLKKLKEEVLDLEEIDDNISLTDFTLDDFRIELHNFLENNRNKIENAPLGLYSVVPSPSNKDIISINSRKFTDSEKDIIKSGVIFCLKQKDSFDIQDINPLQPYFLVYVRDDGTVRFNYTNIKQILEIYRLMCQGKNEPFHDICKIFNNETNQGKEMDKYTYLLDKSVSEISNVFKKKNNHKIITDRKALMVPKNKQVNNMNDFELVTWLIIK